MGAARCMGRLGGSCEWRWAAGMLRLHWRAGLGHRATPRTSHLPTHVCRLPLALTSHQQPHTCTMPPPGYLGVGSAAFCRCFAGVGVPRPVTSLARKPLGWPRRLDQHAAPDHAARGNIARRSSRQRAYAPISLGRTSTPTGASAFLVCTCSQLPPLPPVPYHCGAFAAVTHGADALPSHTGNVSYQTTYLLPHLPCHGDTLLLLPAIGTQEGRWPSCCTTYHGLPTGWRRAGHCMHLQAGGRRNRLMQTIMPY